MASGDLPFFKFYPLDFAASGKVEAMTTEAVGAYILLLGKAWHQSPPCSLPADPLILAKWSRLGVDGWAGVESMVLACWTKRGDGRLYNARLESEYIKATQERTGKSEGGKRSAAARRQVSSKILQRVLEDTSNISEVRCQSSDSSPPSREAFAESLSIPPEPFQPDPPPWWGPTLQALDRWSTISRKHGLIASRNEQRVALEKLRVVGARAEVIFGGELTKPANLFPRAVEVLIGKGTVFKNVQWACGCIRNEIEDWRANGSPGSNGKPAKRTATDERRAARAASEFAEQIDIPTE